MMQLVRRLTKGLTSSSFVVGGCAGILGVEGAFLHTSARRALVLSLTVICAAFCASERAAAAELRIIDVSGLVRGVSVVKSTGAVSLSYTATGSSAVTCTIKNVDGLSSDRSVVGSSKAAGQGLCYFLGLTAGTWQVTVEGATRWQVRIMSAAE